VEIADITHRIDLDVGENLRVACGQRHGLLEIGPGFGRHDQRRAMLQLGEGIRTDTREDGFLARDAGLQVERGQIFIPRSRKSRQTLFPDITATDFIPRG
jgi:hypothetical protein